MRKPKGTLQWYRRCRGIDLRDEGPVVVELERRGRDVAPPRPTSRKETAGTPAAPAAACLAVRESITRRVEAPFRSLRKAVRVFPTVLDVELPFPLEECLYTFLDVRNTPEGKTRALAVAARREDIRRKLEALAAHDIDPFVLDHEGLALWTQSILERPVQAAERPVPRVIVSLGPAAWTIVIGRGAEFLAAHSVREGDLGRVNRLLQAMFSGSAGSAAEIDAPARPALQCFWTGPGARDAERLRGLAAELSRTWPAKFETHQAPDSFLARALAARALLPGPLRCNLRSGEFVHQGMTRRTSKRSLAAAVLLLAAGAVLIAANVAALRIAGRKERDAANTFAGLVNDLAGYDVPARGEHALQVAREAVSLRKTELAPLYGAFQPSLLNLLEAVVSTGNRNHLRYGALLLTREKVEIAGTSQTWKQPEALVDTLRANGYAAVLERKDALQDERIPFTATATLPGRAERGTRPATEDKQ